MEEEDSESSVELLLAVDNMSVLSHVTVCVHLVHLCLPLHMNSEGVSYFMSTNMFCEERVPMWIWKACHALTLSSRSCNTLTCNLIQCLLTCNII